MCRWLVFQSSTTLIDQQTISLNFYILLTGTATDIVNSFIVSGADYWNSLAVGVGERQWNQLRLIQKVAAKAVTRMYKFEL